MAGSRDDELQHVEIVGIQPEDAEGRADEASSDGDPHSAHDLGIGYEEMDDDPEASGRASGCDRKHRCLHVATACALLGTACSSAVCVVLLGAMQQNRRAVCSVQRAGAGLERRPLPGHTEAPEQPGVRGPEMYGKVREKTIWAFWTDAKDCPSSKRCVLPPAIQLCTESVRKNKGSFDYVIVHKDEVLRYVTEMELPIRFMDMLPPQQKDAFMNAVLARYGGVALDISSVLLHPLDEYWEEMVAERATFWGYMYRINGMHWANAEVAAVWLLMTRREGIFSTAVRSQIINMGDHRHPQKATAGGFHNPYFAMGDQTLTPILTMFNYNLPSCLKDPTVMPPVSWNGMCPELEFKHWRLKETGEARNDAKLILREPREGPQLPFAFVDNFSMPLWNVRSDQKVDLEDHECSTMKECWEEVFLPRFVSRSAPGGTRVMNFVKLFNSGGRLKGMTREEILADNSTFFFNWLRLAGHDSCQS